MKSAFLKIAAFAALVLVWTGCDSNDAGLNNNVSEVERLYTPEDGYSVELDPNGSETFEWAPANAEDGGMVMYEIVFDSVGGDFSTPLYRIVSDNNGMGTTATVAHGTLNSAAAQAGLESSETGQLDWTVVTSRGVAETVAPVQNTIQITRLAGFANVPNSLFIAGPATEGGDGLANAMDVKSLGGGVFEIYTRLTAGQDFRFVTGTSGSPRSFSIEEGVIRENDEGVTVDETGVYRFRLDFTTGAADFDHITNVQFFSAPHNDFLWDLPYVGDGVFRAENQEYSFYEWDWGLDSRYKFRLTLDENGEEVYEWWGNDEGDVGRPNDASPPSYWYIYPVPDGADQWTYTFKFNETMHQSIMDMSVQFQADAPYTHTVEKVGDQ